MILVLGAGGFVGSNLVEHLLRSREGTVVAVDVDTAKLARIDDPRLQVHALDVRTDLERVATLIGQADVVVNLVSTTGPAASVRAPLSVIDGCLLANLGILERCAGLGTRLIQFSSCEVYGHPTAGGAVGEHSRSSLGPLREPRWTYAAAYQMLERAVYAHGLESDLDYTILRPFNLIGPRYDHLVPAGTMGGPRMFAHFMSALLTGGPLYLVDGGHRHRTFTHIDDLHRAVDIVVDHPDARRRVFNVGNPANTCTVRQAATLMCDIYEDLTGRPPASDLVDVDGTTFYGQGYDDADRAPPDIGHLRALGWEPLHDLRRTFQDAMRTYVAGRQDPEAALTRASGTG